MNQKELGGTFVEAAVGIGFLAILFGLFLNTMVGFLTAQRHYAALTVVASQGQPKPLVISIEDPQDLASVSVLSLEPVTGAAAADYIDSLREQFALAANEESFLSPFTTSLVDLEPGYLHINPTTGQIVSIDGAYFSSLSADPSPTQRCDGGAQAALATFRQERLALLAPDSYQKVVGTLLYNTAAGTQYLPYKPIVFGVFCGAGRNTPFVFFHNKETGKVATPEEEVA